MSILTKLKDEEIAIVDILRHPVLGPEFIRNFNDIPEDSDMPVNFYEETYYEHTDYQKRMLCDFNPYVVLCCARQIGKTETLIDKITFYLINNFWNDQYITFMAPNKVHMDPVFSRLRLWLGSNEFLKHLVDRGSVNSGNFTIKLKSGGNLVCRIAGTSGTGQNVIGLHSPIIIIDESQAFPWSTWEELQPVLNHWTPGFQMMLAGVPDGRRERSVLFHADQKDEHFTHHRIPSAKNPRWSETAEKKAQEQYQGVNSQTYIHLVLGEHGTPVFAIFDRATMKIEAYDTIVRELRLQELKEDKQAGYRQILELPQIPRNAEQILFGIDIGLTVDPTVIIIMYLSNGAWYQHARLVWRQIDAPEQERLIAFLDNKFNPHLIGTDDGSSGKPIIQHLLMDEKYKDRKFNDRLVAINFASTVSIGKDEEGNDIKIRAKEYSVQYLQQLSNNHRIVYSKLDEELITEFERTTYTKSISGHISFKTFTERGGERGGDHNLAAYLSGFLAWYIRNESTFILTPKPKLFSSRWIIK
jgi:hypothetical protein